MIRKKEVVERRDNPTAAGFHSVPLEVENGESPQVLRDWIHLGEGVWILLLYTGSSRTSHRCLQCHLPSELRPPTWHLHFNISRIHRLSILFSLSKAFFSQSPVSLVNVIEHWHFGSNLPSLGRLPWHQGHMEFPCHTSSSPHALPSAPTPFFIICWLGQYLFNVRVPHQSLSPLDQVCLSFAHCYMHRQIPALGWCTKNTQ